MVELARVRKVFHPDVVALESISLSVAAGELFFLTGISGSGKTTLLNILCGIEQADQGLVEVAGLDLGRLHGRGMQRLRRSIGVAYQDFKLISDYSVAQNLALPLHITRHKESSVRKKTDELLERLGLEKKKNTPAGSLSSGEKQRVAVGRALIHDPLLVLADEPTGNLDEENARAVLKLFEERTATGTTVIITTHDERLYRDTSYRVMELRLGHPYSASSRHLVR